MSSDESGTAPMDGAPGDDRVRAAPGTIRRVLLTGAEGVIGGILRPALADAYELSILTRRPAPFPSHVADISNLVSVERAVEGIDAVVHLAAASSVDAPWDDVLTSNLVGAYNVFEAARRAGVRRVVFASSNHVIGMHEAVAAPTIYHLDDPRVFDEATPLRPDSLYGASKVFGEALGRLYADRFDMDVICLRIGSVTRDDDPTRGIGGRSFEALPPLSAEDQRRRLRATWLSHRDCAELFRCALDAPVHWAIVYGVSGNPRRFWELRAARELLGFEPRDSAGG